jgi:hypothetical protein
MKRKQYESQNDRDAENEVIKILNESWGTESRKLSRHWVLDFALMKSGTKRVCSFVEVRCRSFVWRNAAKDFADGIFCGCSKIAWAMKFWEVWSLPTIFAVRDLEKEIRYCVLHLAGNGLPLYFDGRSSANMRDQWDQDLLVKIPWNRFQSIRSHN